MNENYNQTYRLWMQKRWAIIIALLVSSSVSYAQGNIHRKSDSYTYPSDSRVMQKLTEWRDLKFGILLHWGVYSVPGICESWTLTSEDWITPDPELSYEEYKRWYWGLSKDFNPQKFNPAQWAEVARKAGMRYAIFTTKHHDGFCLWNTRETDYSVMHSGFAGNEKSDVCRYVFDAFRNEGMMMGAYFSKPDWHSPYYWWDKRATHDRMHNYPISQYPERWEKYKTFVYNQIKELVTGYGQIDILWLDGGWCTKPKEDIALDKIAAMVRQQQPSMLIVERACPGEFEDYQTPEQQIPAQQITTPWESCITLTDDWGWSPKPRFKTPTRIVSTLCEIVAKGGSLLLGVGPTPEGLIEDGAVERLEAIGRWMDRNGEAIYATKTMEVYRNEQGNVWFTSSKDDSHTYALVTRTDTTEFPSVVSWKGNVPRKGQKIRLLGTDMKLQWSVDAEEKVTVQLPVARKPALQQEEALVLKY